MRRKVMPYVPYIVVIVSLIIAIIMVVVLNEPKQKNATDQAKETTKAKTVGDATKSTKPAYEVRTSPATTLSTPEPKSTAVATKTVAASATVPSQELANSGPGETMAMFVASVFAFSGLHSLYLRKKAVI